jgi:hypothetical protein
VFEDLVDQQPRPSGEIVNFLISATFHFLLMYFIVFTTVSKIISPTFRLLRRFGGPDKQTRSVCRADKMWRRFAVGMSEANDLGKP